MLMKEIIAILLVLQCSELSLSIKVPIIWDESRNSEVKEVEDEPQTQLGNISPHRVLQNDELPVEYFEYTAKKPQFAIDVAKFHGAQVPENLFQAYPVKPYTGVKETHLGNHQLINKNRDVYEPYQKYVKKNSEQFESFLTPTSSSYEVFHPYKEEEPALQIIYKDPVLDKIRNDLKNSNDNHEDYVKEAGNSDINKSEYLESPAEYDRKMVSQRNIPTKYEIHRTQRRPAYYKAPLKLSSRDKVLNQKFRHPWNQNYIKIRPKHYRPLKNHLQHLRQHHSSTYDDEHNEYPQTYSPEQTEPSEGYDIYENAKLKFNNLRNNVDESINKAVQENNPSDYKKLEFQNKSEEENVEEDDFIPIKNYAQVRKTETTQHLPRQAALEEAESLDEIKNAPRLREAIKSTKAQTVYTEEGYEDAAYDHAGEQKHASDHEGHGGYLKQHELSQGKFKIPSVSTTFADAKGNIVGDSILHKKKWNDSNKDKEEEIKSDDFTENEHEELLDSEIYHDIPEDNDDISLRNKRENHPEINSKKINNDNVTESGYDMSKSIAPFKVPEINLTSTYLTENQILKLAKLNIVSKKDDIKEKYPYYFQTLKNINKDSPLKYAENFKLIPKKSKGGTEFYDSRSQFLCPEVDDKLDPIPEKLKKNGDPDSDETSTDNDKKDEGFRNIKENPRLKDLGDKIDCFKVKYFGENPLDSPFFNEDLIINPQPVIVPSLHVFRLQRPAEKSSEEKKLANDKWSESLNNVNIFDTINNMRSNQEKLKKPLEKNDLMYLTNAQHKPFANTLQHAQQNNLYEDILMNIRNGSKSSNDNIVASLFPKSDKNNYNEQLPIKLPLLNRNKRGTPFNYEPYKIIREGQVKDTKKSQTTTAVSPLIKQLQSSKIIDKTMQLIEEPQQPLENSTDVRMYKNIGKKDREVTSDKIKDESSFVDVSVDPRRGEPRYELKLSNHKSEYTPVVNKKSMSLEDYETQINSKQNDNIKVNSDKGGIPKNKDLPFYNIASFLPNSTKGQLISSASKTVRRIIKTTTMAPENYTKPILNENIQDSVYDEEEEDEYDETIEEKEFSTTTTTTEQSILRRKSRKTTTEKPKQESDKLKLVTRFHSHTTTEQPEIIDKSTRNPETIVGDHIDDHYPKYREKKKKSTMRTLVTDSKRYGDEGDEEDNKRKTEVDTLIGVKQDMDDYLPEYEKEHRNKSKRPYSELVDDEDEDDDDEDEDEDEEEIDEENTEEDSDEHYGDETSLFTTPEPTKRTLPKTTESPPSTTEAHSAKIKASPIILKKKVEINKELPINISSPHQTQFRQNIKEIEIVKEIPTKLSQKKPQKDVEALEFYKDENLAKDINKLKDVEVFRENLDLEKSPRHGGNYKSIHEIEPSVKTNSKIQSGHGGNLKAALTEDVEASQSESKRLIEIDESSPKKLHGGNLKSINDYQRARDSKGQNSKLIELKDENKPLTPMHGGNLKSIGTRKKGLENNKSSKYIELDEEHNDNDEDSASGMHGGNFKPYGNSGNNRPMHGGNYRNSKLVQAETSKARVSNTKSKPAQQDPRRNAATLLSGFAQAVPLLTTTPGYILDPSKRMYYYADV